MCWHERMALLWLLIDVGGQAAVACAIPQSVSLSHWRVPAEEATGSKPISRFSHYDFCFKLLPDFSVWWTITHNSINPFLLKIAFDHDIYHRNRKTETVLYIMSFSLFSRVFLANNRFIFCFTKNIKTYNCLYPQLSPLIKEMCLWSRQGRLHTMNQNAENKWMCGT